MQDFQELILAAQKAINQLIETHAREIAWRDAEIERLQDIIAKGKMKC